MKRVFALLLATTIMFAGCENGGIDLPTPQLTLTGDADLSPTFGAEGGEFTISFTANCPWSADATEDWVRISPDSGEAGEATITVNVDENMSDDSREANIIIRYGENESVSFTLSQSEAAVFEVDGEGRYVLPAEGGTIEVKVTTNIDYVVNISDDAREWITQSDTRAVREDCLVFTVAENTTDSEREATISISDESGNNVISFEVVQSKKIDEPANNEIWYTNGSTTGATDPYMTNVFGANIVSNLYDAEKECWVITFDGDVKKIGNAAFMNCVGITSVTIPNSATEVGHLAFSGCPDLTSATISDGVIKIGSFVFAECVNLTSVTIGNNVTEIDEGAFLGCYSLTSITIPDSVITIGDYVFRSCSSLSEVNLGNGLITIDSYAFLSCSELASIVIPESVTEIGDGAFHDCPKLAKFEGKFAVDDGKALVVDDTLVAFAVACGATEYVIPENVTTVGCYAFYSCNSLTSVTIPEGVTSIGEYAFYSCRQLATVYCKPTTTPAIGGNIFYDSAGPMDCIIYVPTESVEAYKESWSMYSENIVGYDF